MKKRGPQPLSPQQDAACMARAAGATQEDAYQAGFGDSKNPRENASRMFKLPQVRARMVELQAFAVAQTETDAIWVRSKLKAEAENKKSGPMARIRAIQLIGKLNGDFEKDNRQRAADVKTTLVIGFVEPREPPPIDVQPEHIVRH